MTHAQVRTYLVGGGIIVKRLGQSEQTESGQKRFLKILF